MKKLLLFALAMAGAALLALAQDGDNTLTTIFEKSGGRQSATYKEAVGYYEMLQDKSHNIKIQKAGNTDGDNPLYVVYYSTDGDFNIAHWHEEGKVILLINNAIHPGEPDGVDACMMLLRDAVTGKVTVPDNVVLAVIPVYNVGGALNRNTNSRVNQNGPEAYGFRGNAQNLDLNRDFIKCDAMETRGLERLFRSLDPDMFIDNHVSDGADYQHVMTLLATQHDKLGGKTGDFMYSTLTPLLYKDMKKDGYDLVPYVNDFDNTPENGWREFYESPRYSSGYAALFQTISYVPETHMLKPYKDRVWSTYYLMKCLMHEASANAGKIKEVRAADRTAMLSQKEFVLDWKPDTSRFDMITFKGFASGHKLSEVSGLPRLYYDHSKPFSKQVRFYDHFIPIKTAKAPTAYVIPCAWRTVISRLKRNGVEMERLKKDSMMAVTAYHIDNYETTPKPYEKHYLHRNVQVTPAAAQVQVRKGDYIIRVNQPTKRFLVETLEPTAPDGFFAWNFFDGILQQKEYFGDYVFEDVAAGMLKKDPELKARLEAKQKSDTAFANNAGAQLDFIYRQSQWMEEGYNRYPVYRVE